jgi:hypothetical protein
MYIIERVIIKRLRSIAYEGEDEENNNIVQNLLR